MPLKIRIRRGALFVVNGVVMQNVGDDAAHFLVQSKKARILAEPYLMSTDEAVTPLRKLYFALQGAYVEATQSERRAFRRQFFALLAPLLEAADEGEAKTLKGVRTLVMSAEYYQAIMKLYGYLKEVEP